MPTDHDLTATERQALQQWLQSPPPPREPDAMELAAWMEGRLEESEARNLERWLAADPTLLDALPLNGAASQDWQSESVPEVELRRAQALISPLPPEKSKPAPHWPVRLLGGALGLATAIAGLVVGLGLAQVQTQAHTQMETQAVTALMPDMADLPGGW